MDWKGLKVGIFGLGVSGISALELLAPLDADLSIINRGDPQEWGQQHYLLAKLGRERLLADDGDQISSKLGQLDLIILSPGIPREHPALAQALHNKIPIWNEVELASKFLKEEKIIALTGTNGKTSTVSLI